MPDSYEVPIQLVYPGNSFFPLPVWDYALYELSLEMTIYYRGQR